VTGAGTTSSTGVMRVLILSDTHGRTDRVLRVLEQAAPFDRLLFAGDHAADDWEEIAEQVRARGRSLLRACGNCDLTGSAEVETGFDLLGVPGLLVHGHTLQVKSSPLPLFYRAQELGARLTVFGHTHTPTLFVEEGRVFLNPGSLSYPRGYTECTYAVLGLAAEQDGVVADFAFYTLGGTRIPAFDLTHRFERLA
jgi:uncharacterized protein